MDSNNYNTREWKSATDSKSGRVYYYNTRTKETTWTKPLELASPEERILMIQKKKETLEFFREMENNIRYRIQRAKDLEEKGDINYDFDLSIGSASDNILYYRDDSKETTTPGGRERFNSLGDEGKSYYGQNEGGRGRLNSYVNSRRVRTISTMDDEILMLMRQPSGDGTDNRRASFSRRMSIADEKPPSFQSRAQAKESLLAQAKESKSSYDTNDVKASSSSKRGKKKQHKRRNSTGTIYIETTMSSQDNTATIECACVVIRAHMVQAAKENIVPLPEYDIFKDTPFLASMTREQKEMSAMELVPSLATVKEFFTLIFSKSQLESDCIIMALIYCERLVKETRGRLAIRYDNWRSILFACLVMASKVWDDLSMWNVDFSQVYPTFDLHRVNALELSMLEALKYVIRVSASEYAKYYFHLRSMMVKLGLQHENDVNYMRPLDIAGARKLQLSTEKYEALTSIPLRRHSVHLSGADALRPLGLERNFSGNYDVRPHYQQVGIEQIIHERHMDADGLVHTARKKSSFTLGGGVGGAQGKPPKSPEKEKKDFK